MAVTVYDGGRRFRLETRNSIYEMKADEQGSLLHTHYGRKSGGEDLSYAFVKTIRGHEVNPHETGMKDRSYSLGTLPLETSGFGGGDFRETAVRIRFENGSKVLRFRFVSAEVRDGKYGLDGLPTAYGSETEAKTLLITLRDPEAGIRAELLYGVFEETDTITRALRIVNEGGEPVFLEKAASLQLDFFGKEFDLLSFPGRWARERVPERAPLTFGVKSFGSIRGISGSAYNPSAILLSKDATEETGDAYGFAFVYSGEFLFEAEKTPFGDVRILLGIHPDNFEWKLAPGEAFEAPEVLMTYSDTGISGVSLRFHRFLREHMIRGRWKTEKRPVLLNNWEGTYFRFDGKKLLRMAEEAASLGAGLFVLDDGWFGKRDDDKSGLGDWQTNEKKLGMSLKELGDAVRALGLGFGLWFEPEGLSEDSELFRTHPDWAIRVPGREPALSRYELVLDLSRKDVQDYLIRELIARIREAGLQYLKWDMNRPISDRYSLGLPADRQGELTHRYMLGVYRVLEEIRTAFPDLLIEGCSSGGARFDAGMLYYTPQIWTSDDTDPIERLFIQYGTSMIYPVSAMGAHISASPNHQTGRSTPLRTRAVVAMNGTFGLELDPARLTDSEREEIRDYMKEFDALYETIEQGDYYRLIPPTDDTVTVFEEVRPDGSEALINIVYQAVRPNAAAKRFRVQGLLDDALYRLSLPDPRDRAALTADDLSLFDGGLLSGRTLRTVGLYAPVPTGGDYPALQILLRKE